MGNYADLLFFFLVIIPSSIFHEYMHGWAALQLGDPTAKHAGRLTLNPFVHIDLMGTIVLPLVLFFASGGNFLFAYAKPVPYNPYNLKYQKWGPAIVGAAGPLANLFIAAIFGILIQFVFDPTSSLAWLSYIIVMANVVLAVFNLIPIPPLDGSKVLFAVLPRSLAHVQQFMERWGLVLLFLFIFGAFRYLEPVIRIIVRWLVG